MKPTTAGSQTRYLLDTLVAGERSYIFHGPAERFDGTSPLVIAGHGADGNELFCDPVHGGGVNHRYCQAIADRGFIVASSWWTGEPWGSAAGVASIEEARVNRAAIGAKATGPIGFYSGSMGALNALNYWNDHPSNVGALVLVVPASNIDHAYDDLTDQQADIDAAYGGSYASNGHARSPHRFAGDLPARPVGIWGANDDASIRWADTLVLAELLGIEAIDIAPGGHAALGNYQADAEAMLDLLVAGLL